MILNKSGYLSKKTKKYCYPWCGIIAVVGVLSLTGCASEQLPPIAALQAAELAIADADRTRVGDYASVELTEARSKLNAARDAVQSQNMMVALRLAQQSEIEAQLASSKAEVLKAQEVNDDMNRSINMLKEEMQRNTGDNK